MDIDAFKTSWAGLMRTMSVIDPATGLPTADFVRAYAQAPMSLAETDLPSWIFFTGPARYPVPPDQTYERLAKETRDFTARLYVLPAQAGIDGEAERRVQPYVDIARDLMQRHVQLWAGNPYDEPVGINRAYLVSDTGIVGNLVYGKTQYAGIAFTVRVEAVNEVNYATNQ